MLIILFCSVCLTHLFVIHSPSAMLSILFSPLLGYSTSPLYSINTVHAEGQLLSLIIALNTSCKLLRFLLCYLWPPLTFGTSTDCRNSVLWNPRTSICKGEAHKLKPTFSNLLPSCLVPRLAYALPLSSAFVRVRQRNWFWQEALVSETLYTFAALLHSV